MLDLVSALGLLLVLEGAVYALFPDGMKRVMAHVLDQPSGYLRRGGLVAAVIGILVLWLVRG